MLSEAQPSPALGQAPLCQRCARSPWCVPGRLQHPQRPAPAAARRTPPHPPLSHRLHPAAPRLEIFRSLPGAASAPQHPGPPAFGERLLFITAFCRRCSVCAAVMLPAPPPCQAPLAPREGKCVFACISERPWEPRHQSAGGNVAL